MMVEAGARILPEYVMAEAILFGHRALQPLIDLQLQLQEAVGKTKRIPFLEAGTGSVLDFAAKAKAGAEFVVLDVETTGTHAEMADLVEIAAVRIKKGKISDRWSTFVNPGRSIFGNQMHGITDKDVAGAPSPADAAKQALAFVGEATLVGHSVGFDIAFLEAALADGTRIRPGTYLDTLTLARDGYPDLPSYTLGELSRFFGIELKQAHRALPDAEATAALVLAIAADLPERLEALSAGIADSIRANRTSKDDAKAKLEAARRNARVCKALFGLVHKKTARKLTLAEGIRMDGRGVDEIRTITVEVGLLPRAHGSGLFSRGETQALTIATLGPSSDVQRIDTISPETEKRYIHHYNMPPYSTGENKMMRGPGRREIGHGHLAERALLPVLPSSDEFPYVIRLVSECVTSNGSTSMASTCGSTLALMDAGVPITAPVAGAAMGLMSEPDGTFTVLTDILGKEDAFGDMDFKVTGTRDGITALQMDIKVTGINEAIIRQGLEKAHVARMAILDKMLEVLPSARDTMSDFAPRITKIKINPEKIRDIIGKGGSMIRKIQEETGTEINVEDDGTVEIAAVSGENARKAIHWIEIPHPRGRDRRPVPGHRDAPHDLRRIRGDPPGQGGPRPHRRAGRLPRPLRRGRGLGRRRGDGRRHRGRPPGPGQPVPQGRHAAAPRQGLTRRPRHGPTDMAPEIACPRETGGTLLYSGRARQSIHEQRSHVPHDHSDPSRSPSSAPPASSAAR